MKACRWCGREIVDHGPDPLHGGIHWRHLEGNARHCPRGMGHIAEPDPFPVDTQEETR